VGNTYVQYGNGAASLAHALIKVVYGCNSVRSAWSDGIWAIPTTDSCSLICESSGGRAEKIDFSMGLHANAMHDGRYVALNSSLEEKDNPDFVTLLASRYSPCKTISVYVRSVEELLVRHKTREDHTARLYVHVSDRACLFPVQGSPRPNFVSSDSDSLLRLTDRQTDSC
jgi:hypothetical protein